MFTAGYSTIHCVALRSERYLQIADLMKETVWWLCVTSVIFHLLTAYWTLA